MVDREKSLSVDSTAIRVPTLVLWGDRDAVTPISEGRDLARLVPDAAFVELSGAGHIPAIEATERFNTALLEFLQNSKRGLSDPVRGQKSRFV